MKEKPEQMKPRTGKSVETVVIEHRFVIRTYSQNPLPADRTTRETQQTNLYTCPFCLHRTPIHAYTIANGYSKRCVTCGAKLNRNGGRVTYESYLEIPKTKSPSNIEGLF